MDPGVVVLEHPKEFTPEIGIKKKKTNMLIQQHLEQQNFTCFFKDPTKYKHKEIWNSKCYQVPWEHGKSDTMAIWHSLLWWELSRSNTKVLWNILATSGSFFFLNTLTHPPSTHFGKSSSSSNCLHFLQSCTILQFLKYKGKQAKIPMGTLLLNFKKNLWKFNQKHFLKFLPWKPYLKMLPPAKDFPPERFQWSSFQT